MIVRDIAEQWLAEKKLTVKAASYTSYRNLLNNHIYPEFGEFGIPRLPKQNVKQIYVRTARIGQRGRQRRTFG